MQDDHPDHCLARQVVASLRPADVALLLHRAAKERRDDVLRVLRVHGRAPQAIAIVRTRLQELGDDPVHEVLDHFFETISGDTAEHASLADVETVEPVQLLGILRRRWSPRARRVAVEALWHRDRISLRERDDLRVTLGAALDPEPLPAVPPQQLVDPLAGFDVRASPLDAILGEVIQRGLAGVATREDLDAKRQGLEELLRLSPDRPGSWYFYGVLAAQMHEAMSMSPTVQPARLAFLLGELDVAVAQQDDRAAWTTMRAAWGDGEVLLQVPAGGRVAGHVLAAGVADDPAWVAAMLRRVHRPFDGRRALLERIHAATTTLAADDAEPLVRAAEETWWQWAAEDGVARRDLEAEVAGLIVQRARLCLAERDYTVARRLLEDCDVELLDESMQAMAARTSILAQLEMADVSALELPRTSAELAKWRDRLAGVSADLDTLAALDERDPLGPLLAGLRAVCDGDDASAVACFEAAMRSMRDVQIPRPVQAAVRFAHAVAELRLLEPALVDAACARAVDVLREGDFVPAPEQVVTLVDALEAHGEGGAAATILELVTPLVIESSDLRAAVGRLASDNVGGAVELAEQLSGAPQLTMVDRFVMAESAITGALRGGDRDRAERLTEALEELLIVASSAELDDRWQRLLATNDVVRTSLGATTADTHRVDALRRLGRIDEATELVRALFFRAAAGSVDGLDAMDLWHVLEELGAPPRELESLRGLARDDASDQEADAGLPPRHVRILFVGGDETQARYQASIDEALEQTHRGTVEVQWFLCGWKPNWTTHADRIEAAYSQAHAVVLMSFVRTNLGRRIRRSAGEEGLPWVSCTGHGREAVLRAIERAVAAARRERL